MEGVCNSLVRMNWLVNYVLVYASQLVRMNASECVCIFVLFYNNSVHGLTSSNIWLEPKCSPRLGYMESLQRGEQNDLSGENDNTQRYKVKLH